jgi:hypothetical protein
MATARERGDEPEPPISSETLDAIESELESLAFPATGTEVLTTIGDHEAVSVAGSHTIETLVPDTDSEMFDSPAAVSAQIRRPTVAAAMTQVIEASTTLERTDLPWSQRTAYKTTFQELKAISPDDDDEAIQEMTDWICAYIREKERLPGSRDVRRQAAKLCRSKGYPIRNDEWLGI